LDVECVEVELLCSDVVEHQRRVASRTVDMPGLKLPTWQEVLDREYEPWEREHLMVDTSRQTIGDTITDVCQGLGIHQ
jgi:hypothetical protein